MMLHAWSNYKTFAWGENVLAPLTRIPNFMGVFGIERLGATIVDSLDTLYIMGLTTEFQEARDWVAQNFSINDIVSIFIKLNLTP